jgi:hypothetical protein
MIIQAHDQPQGVALMVLSWETHQHDQIIRQNLNVSQLVDT